MSGITLQQIFDKAWDHFIVHDNPPGMDCDGNCMYCSPYGFKCAVGLSIPDGHPAQDSSGAFKSVTEDYPGLFSCPSSHRLNEFQRRLHDDLAFMNEWRFDKDEMRTRYINVARDFKLTVPGESS